MYKPIFFVLIAAASAVFAQPTSDAILKRAERLGTDRRIQTYDALVKSAPGDPHAKLLLAAAYAQKMRETTDFGYIDRAEKLIDAVLAADPKNYEALRLRTSVELERHHFARVVELSKTLIAAAPYDPWNWGTLSDAYLETGAYDSAADSIQKMVDLHPDLASYNRAAHYRFLHNDAAGAIAIMRQAINAGSGAPENVAWCWVELGRMYSKTGHPAEAGQAFRAALERFPVYHSAFAGLGAVQAANGDFGAAIENLRRAQNITPMPEYAAALYDIYVAQGNATEAEKQKSLVLIVDQMVQASSEKVNRNLALIFSDHGWSADRALTLARAELDYRRDVYTYDALAWALYRAGRMDDAEQAAQKALALNTPEPSFYYHAGLIAKALGRDLEARRRLERALALNPKFDLRQAGVAREALKQALADNSAR